MKNLVLLDWIKLNKYDNFKKDFLIFLAVHFFVWSLIPLFRNNIPMDSIEAIVWGINGGWMTNKHPPFSGFIADIFFRIFLEKDIAVYILSQLFVLVGFVYIYKIARLFLNKKNSILSVLMLEGVIYYGFTSIEFNVNVISLALWPATVYYFYRALNKDRIKYWLILGLLVGINVLNKYSCINLFFGMFIYLLINKENRKYFLNKNLYIAGIIALIISLPHIYCLYKTNFIVFEYFKSRSVFSKNLGLFANIVFPLKFLLSQLFAGLGSVLIFFTTYFYSKKEKINVSQKNLVFIFCMSVLPIFATILPSIISGVKIKSMWGTPLLYMLTVSLFSFFPFNLSDNTYRKIRNFVYVVMFIIAISFVASVFFCKSMRINFPREKFINDIYSSWSEDTNNSKLKYVMGDVWYTSILSVYSKDRPEVIYNIDRHYKNRLTNEELEKNGVLIVGTNKNEVLSFQERFNIKGQIDEYGFYTKNILGKKKDYILYYSIVSPNKIGEKND